jgi:hypothetical protein
MTRINIDLDPVTYKSTKQKYQQSLFLQMAPELVHKVQHIIGSRTKGFITKLRISIMTRSIVPIGIALFRIMIGY